MSFLSNLRAERLIAEIKAAGDADGSDAKKALEKLGRLGPAVIPRVIDALASADRRETAGYVDVLASMIDNRNFPVVAAALNDGNQRTASAVALALSSARSYNPQLLYGLLDDPKSPKAIVINALAAQKARLNARDLLKRAYVEVGGLEIPTHFRDFQDFWTPFLRGTGPAPAYVASLPRARRDLLRRRLADRLKVEADGVIRLEARAWAVRGRHAAA